MSHHSPMEPTNFIKNKLLTKNVFFDSKNFSYFIKKYRSGFYFLDPFKIFLCFRKVLFIFKKTRSEETRILFVGLKRADSRVHKLFNKSLKSLAIKNGHLYTNHLSEGHVYDYFSKYKRKTTSEFCAGKLPCLLFIFSRTYEDSLFKEFSRAGVPSFYFMGQDLGFNNNLKDYTLFGTYSSTMLTFYLDFLNYCFTSVETG